EILGSETLLRTGDSSFARDAVQDFTYLLATLKPTANKSSTPQKRNLGRRLFMNVLAPCTRRVFTNGNSRKFRSIRRNLGTNDAAFVFPRIGLWRSRLWLPKSIICLTPLDTSLSCRRQPGNCPLSLCFSLLGCR